MSPVVLAHNPVSLPNSISPHILKNGLNGSPPTVSCSSSASVPTSATSQSTQTNQPWRPKQVEAPKRTAFSFDAMSEALEAFASGEFLVVMDDENRENEGDLIIAGGQCTPEKMAWMIKYTRYANIQSVFFHVIAILCYSVPPPKDPLTHLIHHVQNDTFTFYPVSRLSYVYHFTNQMPLPIQWIHLLCPPGFTVS
jgi:hypothetical protein